MGLFLIFMQPQAQETAEQARLAAILKKSAEYCQRLDKAALDFVCLEEVTEASRYSATTTEDFPHDYQFNRIEISGDSTPQTYVYLYDYQFIRKDTETKETRNLIAVNGKKKNILYSLAYNFLCCFYLVSN